MPRSSLTEASILTQLEHVRHAAPRVYFTRFARHQGKTTRVDEWLRRVAATNGGLPDKPIVMQARGVCVVWDTTGEVRTVENVPYAVKKLYRTR